LKLARNRKGFIQNSEEVRNSNDYVLDDLLANVFDYEDNYHWIEMELAKPVTLDKFKQIVGIDFDTYIKFIQSHHHDVTSIGYSNTLRKNFSQEFIDDMYDNNEFVYDVLTYIGSYDDVFIGDLSKIDSYGIVKRNGVDRIVLIDFGLTSSLFNKHYLKQKF
jgi:hypothetical protein